MLAPISTTVSPSLQADAVPQVAVILEDLLVEIVGLVPVQVDDFQAVRQDVSRHDRRSIAPPAPGRES